MSFIAQDFDMLNVLTVLEGRIQAVSTELGFIFMSMNLTKLAKNLKHQLFKNHTVFLSVLNPIKLKETLCGFICNLVFAQPLYFNT